MNVAVILSENTKKQIAFSKELTDGLRGADRAMSSLFSSKEEISEFERMLHIAYDPKFITDRVMYPLISRFHSLQIVGNVAQFRSGNYDLVAIVDVSFVNTFNDGFVIGEKYEAGATINVYFIDRQNALVGQVEVSQLRKVKREKFWLGVAEIRAEVLDRYTNALVPVLGPERMLAPQMSSTPTSGTPVSSRALPITERLKLLDEMLKQGLITPEEAAKKRGELLKEL